jgi:hypothetical protein
VQTQFDVDSDANTSFTHGSRKPCAPQGSRDSEIDSGKRHFPRATRLTIHQLWAHRRGGHVSGPVVGHTLPILVTYSPDGYIKKWRDVGIEMSVHRALCEITDMESHVREVGSLRFSFITTTEPIRRQVGWSVDFDLSRQSERHSSGTCDSIRMFFTRF